MTKILSNLHEAFLEIFHVINEYVPKIIHICLWAITGIVVLPCVFIANHFYPKWVKWGEDF